MVQPADSPARQLAETLVAQQETALTELGLELGSQYQVSHAEQAQLATETANNAVSDQTIGELSRLIERANLTNTYGVGKVSTAEAHSTASPGTVSKILTDSGQSIISGNKTKHAVERTVERGVSESAISDAMINPLFVGEVVVDTFGRKSVRYIGTTATVVLNPDTGDVITVWETGSRTRKKYGGND